MVEISSPSVRRKYRIPFRYRGVLFALIMSCSTALIVSGVVINLRSESHAQFVRLWLSAFITAWPIVFVAILTIAPAVNKLLNAVVEEQ
jgi:hypothetical protein